LRLRSSSFLVSCIVLAVFKNEGEGGGDGVSDRLFRRTLNPAPPRITRILCS
jgi:hypothetical protein